MCFAHSSFADMSMPVFPGQSLEIHNRPHYARSDRGDRDRLLPGKRDAWGLERASAAPSYHRASGLSSTNGSPLGPPNKRRPPGRHTFYGENARHGGNSRSDPSPGYGPASPADSNGSGRKSDRDAYYSSGGSSILGAGAGYNGSGGADYRSKDVEDRHNRESYLQSGDGRESVSSAVMEHLARPYHSQVFSECNGSWDRDGRPRSSISGWDVPQRGEREHRDRVRIKPDMYRRSGSFSQFDTASWHGGDKDLDGRSDRYGGSNRDTLFSDTSNKDVISTGHEWKSQERTSASIAIWNSGFSTTNGPSRDSPVKQHGLQDVMVPVPSPQQSPFSSPTSASVDGGRDDGGFSSPRKRPRLGWGQGLAKYEKKKVVESEDAVCASASVKGETADSYQSGCDKVASPVRQAFPSKPTPSLVSTTSEFVNGNNEVSSEINTLTVVQVVEGKSLDDKTSCQQVSGDGVPGLPESGKLGSPKGSIIPTTLVDNMKPALETVDIVNRPSALNSETSSGDPPSELVGQQPECAVKERTSFHKNEVGGEIQRLELGTVVLGNESLAAECTSAKDCLRKGEEGSMGGELQGTGCPDLTPGVGSVDSIHVTLVHPPLLTDTEERESAPVLKEVPEAAVSLASGPQTENIVKLQGFDSGHELDAVESTGLISAELQLEGQGMISKDCGISCSDKVQPLGMVEDGQEVILGSVCAEEESCAEPAAFFRPSKVKVETREGQDNAFRALLAENRQAALQASKSLSHLLPHGPELENEKLHNSPVEAAIWQANAISHDRIRHQLQERLIERKRCRIFKEKVLAIRYRALKEVWSQEQLGRRQRRDRSRVIRKVEVDRRNGPTPCQRTSSRLRPTPSGAVRPDALLEEVQAVKRLLAEPIEQVRSVERMPTMILDEKDRFFQRFVTKNGLVEDPVAVEWERQHVNPWTDAEKKLFMEKYAIYCKNFPKIASFFEHKTTADCVEFYYRNQKSEDFEKIHRRQQLKKRRDYSRSSASYLATTTPASNRHREANAVRVEALTMAVASASAAALASAGGRDQVKSLRTGSHKPLDRGKGSCAEMVVCDSVVSVKPIGPKECKAASSLLAVAAGTPGLVTSSCSLSSAATLPKSCRERQTSKGGVAGGPSARNLNADHSMGCKGARSMQVKRESMKATAEEVESEWTEHEKQLFRDSLAAVGKNFKSIASQIGTKTQGQCRAFFSKVRKRPGLDQLVEQADSTIAVVDFAVAGMTSPAVLDSEKVDVVRESPDPPVTEAQAMDIDTSVVKEVICDTEPCKEKAEDVKSQDHDSVVEACAECSPTSEGGDTKTDVEEGGGITDSIAAVDDEVVPPEVAPVAIAADHSSEANDETSELKDEEPHPQLAEVLAKEEVVPEQGKVIEAVVVESPKIDEGVSKHVVENSSVAVNAESPAAPQIELKVCQVLVKPEPESPSTGITFVNEPVCVQQARPAILQAAAAAVTPVPPVPVVREKVSRAGLGGESKPRREPTSWTQDEKEKFAEIIRKHGKDWPLLHESLPAKSLTQIKTYFQNSKAKLGFAPPEGAAAGSRGGGSRKRKADDSDTSSNAGSGGAVSQQKGSGLTDELSLKVNPGCAGMASAENLAFALIGRSGGQSPEESVTNLHKLLRQLCTQNGYPSQAGLFPLYHPVFAQPLQRAQLSLQQQQIGTSQPLGLQQPGVSQQVHTQQALLQQQVAQLQQQQTVLARKHQLQQQIQQQQASQIMGHQQMVSQLQQQASQAGHLHLQHAMQQALTGQGQQPVHAQVQGQASVQSPTHALSQAQQGQQQVAQKPMTVGQNAGSSAIQQQQTHHHHFGHNQQHANQVLHLQSQVVQPSSRQQQLGHQHFQQVSQKHQDLGTNHVNLQLQQQLQQQVGKLHLQKQLQAAQQGQSQQQQSGSHLPLHHLEQQLVDQQMLQQLHQGEQSLLREVFQASTSHNNADLTAELELRSTGPQLRQLSRVGEAQNSGQVCSAAGKGHDQMKSMAGQFSEGLRPGDVKLFGQSLLSQPSAGIAVQPSVTARASATSNSSGDKPPVVQGTAFANSSSGQSVASIQPAVSLPKTSSLKELGPLSSLGRAGSGVENRPPSWPTVLASNLGMWSSMLSSVQVAGAQVSGDPEAQSVQEAVARMTERVSREARDSEDLRGGHSTDTMATLASLATLPVKLQQMDHLRGMQAEMQRNEAQHAGSVQALDSTRGNGLIDQSGSLLGVGAGDLMSRVVEAERSSDAGPQGVSMNGSGDRPAATALMQRSGRTSDFGASGPSLPGLNGVHSNGLQGTAQTPAIPRQVLDALMKIAEWHNRTVQYAAAAAAATNAAQARSGGSNDGVELPPAWAGEHCLRREPLGGSSPLSSDVVKTAAATNSNAALAGLAAAASMGQTHLVTVPEVLQHVRDSGMFFAPTAGHLMQVAANGSVVNPSGVWGPANSTAQGGLPHPSNSSDSQQRILLQPVISSFRGSNVPWGPSADEDLKPPCSSESSGRDSSVDHHTSS